MASASFCRSLICLSVIVLFAGGGEALAQIQDPIPDAPEPDQSVPDSATQHWTYDATARLNASQAAYKDWEEGGGTNSLAFATTLRGQATRQSINWTQAHELRLSFGIFRQEEQNLRKAEDQIRWNSSLRYGGDDFFRLFKPTLAANLRTQFASGFDYSSNPFAGDVPEDDPRADLEPPVETSAFFAPAFITESVGLTYEPVESFTLRLGAASKQTVVRTRDFRVLYGVAENDIARIEAGAEFASSFDRKLTENIRYRSSLNIFFAFNQTEDPPDALWENTVNLEVNDWLSTDLEFVALYDSDITRAIQLKETISLGVSFTLL